MELVFNLKKVFLEYCSDLEFKLASTKIESLKYWRANYLKHMQVEWKDKFHFGHNIYIKNRGNLFLGDRCCIGSFSRIWNYAPITIGDDFLAAGGLTLNSATHDPITLEPKGLEIKIGSRVWCGLNVTIVAGVTIGDDVVLGAGSVVVKDIPSGCIAVGVPAKPIKKLAREGINTFTPFTRN